MMNIIKSFLQDDSGATAIEYGLIAALVSVAAIGALTSLGGSLEEIFTVVSNELGDAATNATAAAGAGDGDGS